MKPYTVNRKGDNKMDIDGNMAALNKHLDECDYVAELPEGEELCLYKKDALGDEEGHLLSSKQHYSDGEGELSEWLIEEFKTILNTDLSHGKHINESYYDGLMDDLFPSLTDYDYGSGVSYINHELKELGLPYHFTYEYLDSITDADLIEAHEERYCEEDR